MGITSTNVESTVPKNSILLGIRRLMLLHLTFALIIARMTDVTIISAEHIKQSSHFIAQLLGMKVSAP